MPPLSHPLRFLVVALAGWINQQQRGPVGRQSACGGECIAMYDSWVIDEATLGPVLSGSSAEPTITPRARSN